jgi:hypothetical protein
MTSKTLRQIQADPSGIRHMSFDNESTDTDVTKHSQHERVETSSVFKKMKQQVKNATSVKEAVKSIEISIESGVHDYKRQYLETKEVILRFHLAVLWFFLTIYSIYRLSLYNPAKSPFLMFICIVILIASSVMI